MRPVILFALALSSLACSSVETSTTSPCVTGAGTTTLFSGTVSGLSTKGDRVVATTGQQVVSIPLAGGAAKVLAEASSTFGVVVMGDTAYYTADHEVGSGPKPESATGFYAVPLAGGAPALLVDDAPFLSTLATDGSTLYFVGPALSQISTYTPPATTFGALTVAGNLVTGSLALHGEHLYLAAQDFDSTEATNGVIARIPRKGGEVERLVSGIGHPWSLVVNEAGLFWMEDAPTGTFGPAHLRRAALDGSSVSTMAEMTASTLAASAEHLYYGADVIGVLPLAGGDPKVIASGVKSPAFLTLDGGNVVWVDNHDKALSDPSPMRIMTACIP